jgi:hypothetical protein
MMSYQTETELITVLHIWAEHDGTSLPSFAGLVKDVPWEP